MRDSIRQFWAERMAPAPGGDTNGKAKARVDAEDERQRREGAVRGLSVGSTTDRLARLWPDQERVIHEDIVHDADVAGVEAVDQPLDDLVGLQLRLLVIGGEVGLGILVPLILVADGFRCWASMQDIGILVLAAGTPAVDYEDLRVATPGLPADLEAVYFEQPEELTTQADEVVDGWMEIVEDTMQPEAVGVWVKQ